MELPFGGTESSRHVRDRLACRGVGRRHHDRRHGRAALRRERARGRSPSGTARPTATAPSTTRFHQIIGGVDDESLKAMQLPHRARGHHQLQAVHGLPGRVLQRRRPDPAGDAGGRRLRGDDHDARRERHRHRRARAAGAGPRRDRSRSTTATPGRRRSRREATHRAIVLSHVAGNVPLYIVHMSAGDALDEVAAARHAGPQRVRRDLPAVPVADARGDARPSPASRAPSGCARTPMRSKDHDPDYIGQMGHGHQGDLWRACG